MFIIKVLLNGVLLPALIAGLALFVAWRPWRRGGAAAGGHWGGAIGLAAGYAVGHGLLAGWPAFPAVSSTQWLFWLAFGAMGIGLLDALVRLPAAARWGIRGATSLLVGWILLRPLTATWGAGTSVLWILAVGAGIFAFWSLADRAVRDRPGAGMPIAFLALTAGGSAVLLLSASALLAQLAGVVAATLGAAMVLAFWRPSVSLERGAVPVVGVLLPALWVSGHFYAEMPLASAALLLVAPAALWLGRIGPFRDWTRWKSALAHVGAVMAPVILALGLAALGQSTDAGGGSDATDDPYDYESYYESTTSGSDEPVDPYAAYK